MRKGLRLRDATEIESSTITRREFIKSTGIVLGGVALTTLAVTSGCNKTNLSSTTSATGNISTAKPSTTSPTPTNSLQPSASPTSYKYIPSMTPIPLQDTPNCYTKVALDRLYSLEHIWVNTVGPDIVTLGISDKFSAILYKPRALSLVSIGFQLTREMPFGSIEASKMNADLLSPVTGTVIDANMFLLETQMKGVFEPVVGDPYGQGWMIAVKLSKPDELNDLLTPAQYLALVTPLETGG